MTTPTRQRRKRAPLGGLHAHDRGELMRPYVMPNVRSDWETPPGVFAPLNEEFAFTVDVCATAKTAKCEKFYTFQEDAFTKPWHGVCWMNPPYGKDVVRWVRKAQRSATEHGTTVVCLLPARTDTAWFHEIALAYADEVRFIRGRIRFVGAAAHAPFPSMLLIFRGARRQASCVMRDFIQRRQPRGCRK